MVIEKLWFLMSPDEGGSANGAPAPEAPAPEPAADALPEYDYDDDSPTGDATPSAPASAAPVAPPAPEFPAELLQRGKDWGFSAEDAKDFGTPEKFQRYLAHAEKLARQAHEFGQQQYQQRAAQQRAEQVVQNPQPTQPPPQQWKFEESMQALAALKEAGFDPKMVDAFSSTLKGMHEHYTGQLKQYEQVATQFKQYEPQLGTLQQMQQHVEAMRQHHMQQAQQAYFTRVESWFDKQGEQWTEVFGKGTGHSLKEGSAELANRVKVVEMADRWAAAEKASGRQVDEAALLDLARDALFAKHYQKLAKADYDSKLRNRQGQFLPRPTSRNGVKPNVDNRTVAIQNVREKWGNKLSEEDAEET